METLSRGITVKETAAQYAARILDYVQSEDYNVPVELRKVTVRVPDETVSLLDYMAEKLRMSRSALAEELLTRAVQEAVVVIGLPGEADAFQLTLREDALEAVA